MKKILVFLAILLFCSTVHAELWGSGSASTLIVKDAGDENATYYLLLMQAIDGALVGKTDGGLTYNPSTNLFTMTGALSVPFITNVGTIGASGDADLLSLADGILTVNGDVFFGTNNAIVFAQASPTLQDRMFASSVGIIVQENLSSCEIYCDTNDNNSATDILYLVAEGDTRVGGTANSIFTVRKNKEVEFFGDVIAAGTIIAGGATIGDGTNETQIDGTGKLTLAGTARVIKHLHFTMELGKGQSAPAERFDEDPYVSYTYGINDDSHLSREAPDNMDYTADSIIKIHWYTTDATAGGTDEIRWEVQWASRAVGEDITAGDTIGNSGDIVCSAQNIIVETSVITIAGNSIAANDMIGIHVKRVILGDGTNPQASTIHIIDVELQYIANKLGESL